MLFNSFPFLLAFLPASFLLFWYGSRSLTWRLGLLTLGSYVFYSWWQFSDWDDFVHTFQIHSWDDLLNTLWHWRFTLIMLFSSSTDYWAAKWIARTPLEKIGRRRLLLALSLTVNLGFLGFFKYFGFFSQIASDIGRALKAGELPIYAMALPVGISFYTFESISYVIDIYRGLARPAKSYLDYACFISFFPHLVAGPIIRYSDILHQFRDVHWARPQPDWEQVNYGILFFTMGMVKKLLIADLLAVRANALWDVLGQGGGLGLVGSWGAVLGYTFRIYFDFSGYSDMAQGLGHLFAIRLPQNFDSPYKATDPSDFWRRWHISLSHWLRDYLYFPLGGNRNRKQARNLLITMFLGGLWHGAAWAFILWGLWHGMLLVVFHQLKSRGWVPSTKRWLGYWVSRQVTFLLVVIGWVFFRVADVHGVGMDHFSLVPMTRMFGAMLGLEGLGLGHAGMALWLLIGGGWLWCNFAPNSFEVVYGASPKLRYAFVAGGAMAICFTRLSTSVDFLYFRF